MVAIITRVSICRRGISISPCRIVPALLETLLGFGYRREESQRHLPRDRGTRSSSRLRLYQSGTIDFLARSLFRASIVRRRETNWQGDHKVIRTVESYEFFRARAHYSALFSLEYPQYFQKILVDIFIRPPLDTRDR